MKPVHFDIPFPLIKGKGGVMRLLSANLYRNAYFHTLNNAKTVYDKVLDPVLQNIKPFTHPVKIDFKFFFKTKRRRDIDNFQFPVSKFLCDSMTKRSILVDDNMMYYPEMSASWGGLSDADYVQITISKSKVKIDPTLKAPKRTGWGNKLSQEDE